MAKFFSLKFIIPSLLLLVAIPLHLFIRSTLEKAEYSVSHNQPIFVGPNYLDQYTIENLSKRGYYGSDFKYGEKILEDNSFATYRFSFKTKRKIVTGLSNVPKNNSRQFPVILMVRGYVDRDAYSPGTGTKRAAEIFASKGYMTLAPDFLGYGNSDNPSTNSLEERFETYTTLLDLYSLIPQIPNADSGKTYIWGHSNGGQITLTLLEVTGKNIPTILWAPVSKPFPYSILYYTDEFDDLGKALRKVIADFEFRYDVSKYSITSYLDRINAPILLQQGTSDTSVMVSWSNELYKNLKTVNKDVEYVTYEDADHNLSGKWNNAIIKDLEFLSLH